MFQILWVYNLRNGEIQGDVPVHVEARWMKWRLTSVFLCDKNVSLSLNVKFYKMIVSSTMLYRMECWPVKNTLV